MVFWVEEKGRRLWLLTFLWTWLNPELTTLVNAKIITEEQIRSDTCIRIKVSHVAWWYWHYLVEKLSNGSWLPHPVLHHFYTEITCYFSDVVDIITTWVSQGCIVGPLSEPLEDSTLSSLGGCSSCPALSGGMSLKQMPRKCSPLLPLRTGTTYKKYRKLFHLTVSMTVTSTTSVWICLYTST